MPALNLPDAPAAPITVRALADLVLDTPVLDERRDRHPAAAYLEGLTDGARRTQTSALNQVADLLGVAELRDQDGRDVRYLAVPWAEFRYPHTNAIRARLVSKYAPATARRYLAAVCRVLEECRRLGLMTADEEQLATDLKPIAGGDEELAGRAIEGDELAALLDACARDTTPVGVRDAAVLGMLYATGMRRSELATLTLADRRPDHGWHVRGKGNKKRTVYATAAAELLDDWFTIRGTTPGPLFYRARRGGHLGTTALTAQGVYDVLNRRIAEAGIAACTPHDFRRTHISDALDAGADIVAVQKNAGHADTKTTSKYDRRGERAKKKAAALVTLPRRTLPLDD
jgi:integrase/recombinase XerD